MQITLDLPQGSNLPWFVSSVLPLVGPRFGWGDCLAPKYPAGTLFWIDPGRTPENGDLVWYHFTEEWCAHLKATYGFEISGGAKYFRVKAGNKYLESNEGAVPFDPKQWIIEGVVAGTFTFRHPPAQLAEMIAKTNAQVAEAEEKRRALKIRTPLDDSRAVRYSRGHK